LLGDEKLPRNIDDVPMAVDPVIPYHLIESPATPSLAMHPMERQDRDRDGSMDIDQTTCAISYSAGPSTLSAPVPVAMDADSIVQPGYPTSGSGTGHMNDEISMSTAPPTHAATQATEDEPNGMVKNMTKTKDVNMVNPSPGLRRSSRKPLKGIYPGNGTSLRDPIDLTARQSRCVQGKIVEMIDLTNDAVCAFLPYSELDSIDDEQIELPLTTLQYTDVQRPRILHPHAYMLYDALGNAHSYTPSFHVSP
jgi:hypothetical protein